MVSVDAIAMAVGIRALVREVRWLVFEVVFGVRELGEEFLLELEERCERFEITFVVRHRVAVCGGGLSTGAPNDNRSGLVVLAFLVSVVRGVVFR